MGTKTQITNDKEKILDLQAEIYIFQEVFYNKELSDKVRDLVANSNCNFHQAIRFLSVSENHERDLDLIKKMLNVGLVEHQVIKFLGAINI